MTFYVMAPTFDQAWNNGLKPLVENRITEDEAFVQITEPFKAFMRANVREKDLQLFEDLAGRRQPQGQNQTQAQPQPQPQLEPQQQAPPQAEGQPAAQDEEISLRVLIPAFMISELRRGFEIGFLIILPFLVIDMIVATLTMSMGMMMLPPTVISLPFKVLFFVLIDGWNLLVGGLIRSFL